MKCPFVYGDGRECTSYISQVETMGVLTLLIDEDNKIVGQGFEPRLPVHLHCELMGNHRDIKARHPKGMMCEWDQLPDSIRNQFEQWLKHRG